MNKLDQLSELQARADALRMEYERRRAEILAPVMDELTALEAEFAQPSSDLNLAIDALREEIKADVLAHGGTIKGEHFMAVFNKGRTSWDTKRLEDYAAAHPEIKEFKKVGEPSVSIRAID